MDIRNRKSDKDSIECSEGSSEKYLKEDRLSAPPGISTYDTFSIDNVFCTSSEPVDITFNEVNTQHSGESIVKHDNSFIQAMFNFIKSFIGIGVISIASMVKHAGIVNAAIWIIFTAILSIIGTNLTISAREKFLRDDFENEEFVGRRTLDSVQIARSFESQAQPQREDRIDADQNRSSQSLPNDDNASLDTNQLLLYNNYLKSYAEMGQKWFGENGYYFWTLLLALNQIIVVTAYMRFFDEYFKAYAMLATLIPTWMFMDLKSISLFSTISIFLIVHCLFLILGVSISDIPDSNFDEITYLEYFEFPLFFGASVFMFEGDMVWMNIQDSMKNPKRFKLLSFWSLTFIAVMWFIVWFIPYLAYGNGISDPIINSISIEAVRDYLKVAYTAAIGFGCPLMVYPLWEICYRSVIIDPYISLFKNYPLSKFYIAAVVSLCFWYFFSKVIPGIGSFINISGALLGPTSTIIMPVAFYFKAYGKDVPMYEFSLYISIWLISGIMGLISFVATIIDESD